MQDETESLAAKDAIREKLHLYCRAMDRMDRDLALSVWHPEGTADYGATFSGTGAGFVDWVMKRHTEYDAHSHQITTTTIRVDGDRASSEAYAFATLRSSADGQGKDVIVRGRYLDTWSKRDGEWAIDTRIFVTDVRSVHPLDPSLASAKPDPRYRRDRSDPSYQILDR